MDQKMVCTVRVVECMWWLLRASRDKTYVTMMNYKQSMQCMHAPHTPKLNYAMPYFFLLYCIGIMITKQPKKPDSKIQNKKITYFTKTKTLHKLFT